MKNLIKLIQTSLIILTLAIATQAQTNNELKTNTFHVGYVPVSTLSSTAFGIHLGYSKLKTSQSQLALETQFSYTLAIFRGYPGFFERGDGHAHIFNALGGGRLYFTKRKSGKGNLYLNILGGLAVLADQDGKRSDTQAGLGYSFGLFAKTKKNLSFGIAIESAATGVFKVGFDF